MTEQLTQEPLFLVFYPSKELIAMNNRFNDPKERLRDLAQAGGFARRFLPTNGGLGLRAPGWRNGNRG